MKCFIVLCAVSAIAFGEESPKYTPLYKYEEVMKSEASEVPYSGRYFGGFGPRGFDYFGGGYYQPYFRPLPYHGHFGGAGGGFVDKNVYSGENKNAHGDSFQKAEGNKGSSGEHGSSGFSKGEVAFKDAKGDTGFYRDEEGAKQGFDDSKYYNGGQQFNNRGENDQNRKQNASHKKGHATKGFKTSHHKDESGKTETFYDEGNDEGGNYNYEGSQGSFGRKGQSGYKGGHDNGQFLRDEKAKQGQFDSHRVVDNANADKGAYDQKGFHGNGEVYRVNNGIGQQSLLGRQEANREFFRHYPYGHHQFNAGFY